jgi:NADH dehydrogenase
VVIVGAGFGGLAAARALAGAAAEVTVIDRRNYHLFQPLLYQVATSALSPADIAWPVRGLLSRQRNARVVMARVTGVDARRRLVLTEEGWDFPYDYLVLATGARHAYFGHDDWSEWAPGLKKIDDATDIRRRILLAFERAETAGDPAERARLLTFVVVGAGPTGVEMAGAIAEIARHTLTRDFRHIDPRDARVLLVEAGRRVLPAFDPRLSARAERQLRRLGVEVRLGSPVTDCSAEGVTLGDEQVGARTVVWAAGVIASPAGRWLGAATDRAGRVIVAPDLSVPGHPGVYAVGDTVTVRGAGGRPVPGVAPAAKQMGRHAGRLIARRIAGQGKGDKPFRYRDAGSLATIGRGAAVAEVSGIRLSGFPAWALWAAAHVYFLIGARSRLMVAANWLWSYATFGRGARLITGPVPPPPLEAESRERETA